MGKCGIIIGILNLEVFPRGLVMDTVSQNKGNVIENRKFDLNLEKLVLMP